MSSMLLLPWEKTHKMGYLKMESNALIKLTFLLHIGFQHMDKTIIEKV